MPCICVIRHNYWLGCKCAPRFGVRKNFFPDQICEGLLEALSSAVQVGSAYVDQMRTLMNHLQDLCPHLPSCAVLHLCLFHLVLRGRSSLHTCGVAIVGCSCTSFVACDGGSEETPRAWRDSRSLCRCLKQRPYCVSLLSLTDTCLSLLEGNSVHQEHLS